MSLISDKSLNNTAFLFYFNVQTTIEEKETY